MKGISTMIAAVLLIAFTVSVGAIISLWLTGLTRTTTAGAETGAAATIECANSGFEIISRKLVNQTTNEYDVYVRISSKKIKIYPTAIRFSDGTVNSTFTSSPSILDSTNDLITISVIFPNGVTSVTVIGLCEYGTTNTSVEATCRSVEDCWV